MKKNRFLFITLAVLLVFALVYNSCKKDEEKPVYDASAASDNAIADNIFSDVFAQVKDAAQTSEDSLNNKGISSTLGDTCVIFVSPCITLTIVYEPIVIWPLNMTIDFGYTNCIQNPTYDGRARRGKFSVYMTGPYRDSASVITINNFDNYYVDDHKVQGTKTVTNKGHNSDGNLWYTVVVDNAVITKPDGSTIQWNHDTEREWIEGELTWTPWDDVYLITGTQDGVSSSGTAYNITVTTSALNVLVGCKWIRSGTLDLNIQNWPPIAIDYGNGTCDPYAIATIDGVDYPFTMN